MFLTIKRKWVLIFLCFLFIVSSAVVYFTAIRPTFMPKAEHTIVIDAGHGGKDGGAVGKTTSVSESFLNLEYAKTLKEICQQFGFRVVMTRESMEGLYSPFADNKKKSEMKKRQQIIENSNPDFVVSIHMNSFPSSEACGAQIYYAQGSESGQALAESVSKNLHNNIENAKLTSKVGDFYVLNVSPCPSILVECGFLSNPEEEVLLQNKTYMHKFCYHLFCGILQFQEFSVAGQ